MYLFVFSLLISLCTAVKAEKQSDYTLLISRGKKEIKNNSFTSGIAYFTKAKYLALENKDYVGQFEAEIGIGICYSRVADYGHAITHFYKAQQICDDNNLGWKRKTRIMNALAGIYYEHGNYFLSRKMLQHCLQSAIQHNDSVDAVAYALNLVRVTSKMRSLSQALSYLNIVHRYYRGDRELYNVIQYVETNLLFLRGRDSLFISKALPLLDDKRLLQSDKDELLLNLLQTYQRKSMLRDALSLAHQKLLSPGIKNKANVYEWLSATYRKLGDNKKALEMMDSVVVFVNLQQRDYSKQQSDNLHSRIEMMREMMNIDKAMATAKYRQRIFLLLISLCSLAVIMAIVFIFMQRQRSRQHRKLLEMEIRETELQSKYQKSLMKMEMERQSHEISAMSVFMSSRNKLINDLLHQLSNIKSIHSVKEVNDILVHLRQMLKQGDVRDKYITNFEAAHPGLLSRLKSKHPNLTTSDLQFLAYVIMNLTNHDIASLMNVTPDTCKKRRMRISKKLGLDTSSNLYQYIVSI